MYSSSQGKVYPPAKFSLLPCLDHVKFGGNPSPLRWLLS
jgi:hypothetical protein